MYYKRSDKKKIANTLSNKVLLRICLVTLYGSESQNDTFTFLNDGSTVSWIASSVANQFKLNDKGEPLTKFWSKITRHFDSSYRKTNLPVKGLYGGELVLHRKQRPNSVTFERSRLKRINRQTKHFQIHRVLSPQY